MVFKRIRSVAFFSSEIFQSDEADGVQPRRSESQQHAWAGGGWRAGRRQRVYETHRPIKGVTAPTRPYDVPLTALWSCRVVLASYVHDHNNNDTSGAFVKGPTALGLGIY